MRERRARDEEERRMVQRASVQQKILDENQKRVNVEQQIVSLEQEELDLINKLRNTQMLQ